MNIGYARTSTVDKVAGLEYLQAELQNLGFQKIFHEHVMNVILEDFVRAVDPLRVNLEGNFNVRGNIKTVVRAQYEKAV